LPTKKFQPRVGEEVLSWVTKVQPGLLRGKKKNQKKKKAWPCRKTNTAPPGVKPKNRVEKGSVKRTASHIGGSGKGRKKNHGEKRKKAVPTNRKRKGQKRLKPCWGGTLSKSLFFFFAERKMEHGER